jgi:hypothetical protein
MVSPTAAGRTDSPTTSPSAVLPDEYRDLERYGFDDWSGARRCFWPTGPPQRGMRGVGGKSAPPGSSQSCPRSGGQFSAAVDAATFVTGQAMVVDGGLPRPSAGAVINNQSPTISHRGINKTVQRSTTKSERSGTHVTRRGDVGRLSEESWPSVSRHASNARKRARLAQTPVSARIWLLS